MLPQIAVCWPAAMVWLAITRAVGVLVRWLATDVRETSHRPYIALLTVVTLGLAAAYLAWTRVVVMDTLAHNAGWGVLGGILVAVPVSAGIVRISTVRIDPAAGPIVDVTATFATCNCESTLAMPPVPSVPDSASTEKGISAVRADAGADEL